MILKSLVDLAEREAIPLDLEPLDVHWVIEIDTCGQFCALTPLFAPEPTSSDGAKSKKKRELGRTVLVPRQLVRSSGDLTQFLVDNGNYVLGLGKGKADKLDKRRNLFHALAREAAKATGDEALAALLAFLDNSAARTAVLRELERRVSEKTLKKLDDLKDQRFAFLYRPDRGPLLHFRKLIRAFWREKLTQLIASIDGVPSETTKKAALGAKLGMRYAESARRARCPVSGADGAVLADVHCQLKLPGPTSSGVPVVSINARAFESHGWSGAENAPVSTDVVLAYTAALNRLIRDDFIQIDGAAGSVYPKQLVRLSSDTTAVFWADAETDAPSFWGGAIEEADAETVGRIMQSPWAGKTPPKDELARFHLLILTGVQGRAVIRGYHQSTLRAVRDRVQQYFADTQLDLYNANERCVLPRRFPLWQLLRSLAVQGKQENIPPNLAAAVFTAILTGRHFPPSVLDAAVRRCRREQAVTAPRAAIIKACLARRNHEVHPAMDDANNNPGYLFGRLFAVYEAIQYQALGKLNATLTDRLYSAASTRPLGVFAGLERRAHAHLHKMRGSEKGPAATNRAKELDALWSRLGDLADVPPMLALEDQAWFALGYHQQRQADFLHRTKNAAGKKPRAEEPAEA